MHGYGKIGLKLVFLNLFCLHLILPSIACFLGKYTAKKRTHLCLRSWTGANKFLKSIYTKLRFLKSALNSIWNFRCSGHFLNHKMIYLKPTVTFQFTITITIGITIYTSLFLSKGLKTKAFWLKFDRKTG